MKDSKTTNWAHRNKLLAVANPSGNPAVKPEQQAYGLVNTLEAARRLGISPRTLWSLRQTGQIPGIQIGKSVRYEIADLKAFSDRKKDKKRRGTT